MDSDDDENPSPPVEKSKRVAPCKPPTRTAKNIAKHSHTKMNKRRSYLDTHVNLPRGDLTAYVREQESERQYVFNTVIRLVKERGDAPKVTLHVPPWKWSENALLFR